MNPSKKADISRISSSIPLRPSKKILTMLRYYKDKGKNLVKQVNTQNGQSYAQVFLANIKNIVKIKKYFQTSQLRRSKRYRRWSMKKKPRFNMMTKGPSRRQVLVSISLMNSNLFMVMYSIHVTNTNKALKDIKSDTMTDFIWAD